MKPSRPITNAHSRSRAGREPAASCDVNASPTADVLSSAQSLTSSTEDPTLDEALARMCDDEGLERGRDERPELVAAVAAMVDPSTRPPTIIARLEVCGQPTRVSRSQKVRTTSEAILSLLAIFVRGLEAPTCVSLLTDDPMIFRLLSTTSPPRGWLRRAADALEAESSSGDVTIVIEPLEPGKIEEPYGYA